jgi:hypothetical protein
MSDMAATLADAKLQLKIDTADTTDDAYLTALLVGVTDWIQDYVHRLVCPRAAQTFLVDTAAGSVIDVRRYGIRTVTSLSIASASQPDTGGTYTAVAAADIYLRPGELDRDPGMPATSIAIAGAYARLVDAINGARIVGDVGPTATPDRIARVAIDAVAAAYQARRAGGSGVIGADAAASTPWSQYFGAGSPQLATLKRLRGAVGVG